MRADDNELILKRTDETGCVFLKDNLCTVYEARPKSCANYPHLVRGDGSIAEPHVVHGGSRELLPHRLQLDRSSQRGNGLSR